MPPPPSTCTVVVVVADIAPQHTLVIVIAAEPVWLTHRCAAHLRLLVTPVRTVRLPVALPLGVDAVPGRAGTAGEVARTTLGQPAARLVTAVAAVCHYKASSGMKKNSKAKYICQAALENMKKCKNVSTKKQEWFIKKLETAFYLGTGGLQPELTYLFIPFLNSSF